MKNVANRRIQKQPLPVGAPPSSESVRGESSPCQLEVSRGGQGRGGIKVLSIDASLDGASSYLILGTMCCMWCNKKHNTSCITVLERDKTVTLREGLNLNA